MRKSTRSSSTIHFENGYDDTENENYKESKLNNKTQLKKHGKYKKKKNSLKTSPQSPLRNTRSRGNIGSNKTQNDKNNINSSPQSIIYVDDSDNTDQSDDFSQTNTNNINGHSDSKDDTEKIRFNLINHIKEDHNKSLYNVQIYKSFEENPEIIIFATVGSNRCSVYEYQLESDKVELIDAYMDADEAETYYTCAWSSDPIKKEPILAVAGVKGLIRTIIPFKGVFKNTLIGHGSSIHDLRFHPSKSFILLSSSKDYTMRLWNVNTNVCIAIFGGAEGHRDEVLSGDFSLNGNLIMSCSIDHYLKMWSLQTFKLKKAIDDSDIYKNELKSFPTVLVNFPDFSTRDIHTNYIDCVRWFGDLVLSKSCENCIICWKPGLLDDKIETITRTNKNVTILHKFDIKDCELWYIRFSMDCDQKYLTLGNQQGKVYVWCMDFEDPNDIKFILTHPKCKKTIRSTAVSQNGNFIFAVSDDSSVFVWKKQIK